MATIYVPRGHDAERKFLCRVCGSEFTRQTAWEYHVGRCARHNLDELQEERQRFLARANALGTAEHPDPELEEHMRKVGDRMLREGRLTVEPHERAGF